MLDTSWTATHRMTPSPTSLLNTLILMGNIGQCACIYYSLRDCADRAIICDSHSSRSCSVICPGSPTAVSPVFMKGVVGIGIAGRKGMVGIGRAGRKDIVEIGRAGKKGMAGIGRTGRKGMAGIGIAGRTEMVGISRAGKKGMAGIGRAGRKWMAGIGRAGRKEIVGIGRAGKKGMVGIGRTGRKGMVGIGGAGRNGMVVVSRLVGSRWWGSVELVWREFVELVQTYEPFVYVIAIGWWVS